MLPHKLTKRLCRLTAGVFVLLIMTLPQYLSAENLTILTGSQTSSSYRIAETLQKLGKEQGYELEIVQSTGSAKNLSTLQAGGLSHMTIAHHDAVSFFFYHQAPKAASLDIPTALNPIRIISPLYRDEIYILASESIKQLADLQGKIVAMGPENSDNSLTANTLFAVSGIKLKQTLAIDFQQGLARLLAGKIDAVIFMSADPTREFAKLEETEHSLHLIAIQSEPLDRLYHSTIIPAQTFSWQTEDIQTYAVPNYLMVNGAASESCSRMLAFSAVIKQNQDWLATHGHPKWQTIDFSGSVGKLDLQTCTTSDKGKLPVDAADKLEFITGPAGSVTFQMAQDLKRLITKEDSKYSVNGLEIVTSTGPLQNQQWLTNHSRLALGVLRIDLLAYQYFQERQATQKGTETLRFLMPFIRHAVQIMAPVTITAFADLAGKRITVGPKNSGNELTAKLLFSKLSHQPLEITITDMESALTRLKKGETDAYVHIGGYPDARLESFQNSEGIFHLVPILNPEILQLFSPLHLEPKTYSWQTELLRTVGLDTVLAVRYRPDMPCTKIKDFMLFLNDTLASIDNQRTPIWQTVMDNPDAVQSVLKPFECK